jgi:hypothetical protein
MLRKISLNLAILIALGSIPPTGTVGLAPRAQAETAQIISFVQFLGGAPVCNSSTIYPFYCPDKSFRYMLGTQGARPGTQFQIVYTTKDGTIEQFDGFITSRNDFNGWSFTVFYSSGPIVGYTVSFESSVRLGSRRR